MGFAGDTFNTVWYLRTLRPDIHYAFFFAVGTDTISDKSLNEMDAVGIDTTWI